MNDFFDRLRADASSLRHEPDAVTVARVSARIRERLAQPTVAELLARWLRPVAATLAALALAAAISVRATDDDVPLAEEGVEVTVAGATYRVD